MRLFAMLGQNKRALPLVALALLGCAATSSAEARSHVEDAIAITFVVSSVATTDLREQWTAMADGRAMLTTQRSDHWISSTGTIAPRDFARLRAVMARLGRYAAVDLSCPAPAPDTPIFTVRWLLPDTPDALVRFYADCGVTLERREIAATLDEANYIFHEATGLR